jgi:hypothetical protein
MAVNFTNINSYYENKKKEQLEQLHNENNENIKIIEMLKLEIKSNNNFLKNKNQLDNDIELYNSAIEKLMMDKKIHNTVVEQFEIEKNIHQLNIEQFEIEKKKYINIDKIIEFINILPDNYDKIKLSDKVDIYNKYKNHYKMLISLKKHIKNQSKKYKTILDILANQSDDESSD